MFSRRNIIVAILLVLCGASLGVLLTLQYVSPRLQAIPGENRTVTSVQVGYPTAETTGLEVNALAINDLFKQVSEGVRPSVVSIESETVPENDRGSSQQFRGPQRSSGSGVIISKDGYIVTNNHVIEGSFNINVTLEDKREFSARLVGNDPTTDLAVLKIDGDSFPVVTLGNSDQLSVGEWVIAVGNPFHLNSTVTQGIVSAKGRQVQIIDNDYRIEDFIQTDAAINPGNSGGALVNLYGQLIGINTAIASNDGQYQGYGFAIPVNLVTRVADDMIGYGRFRRALLGITMEEVNANNYKSLGLTEIAGVLVQTLTSSNAAAARAGVKRNDVILGIDGRPVDSTNELQREVALNEPGAVVNLSVLRRGRKMSFDVSLDELEAEVAAGERRPPRSRSGVLQLPEWGISLRELEARDFAGFGVEAGAYIAWVRPESDASLNGLPRDVVITAIDEFPVGSPLDVQRFLSIPSPEGEAFLIKVRKRDGTSAFYELISGRDD